MGDKKHLELNLEVKEITGAPTKDLFTYFELSEITESIPSKGHISIPLSSSTPKSLLSISLKTSEKIIGFTKASLNTLFGESLSGKLDRFIKLKSDDYPNLRIKLSGFVSKKEKTKSRPVSVSNNSRRSSKSQREVVCPYLENLMTGSGDMAALNELWKYRDQDQHLIKISLEPGPGLLEPVDHSQVTVEQLRELPGSSLRQVVKGLCEEAVQFAKISDDLPNKKQEFEELVKLRRDLEFRAQEEVDELQKQCVHESERFNELALEKYHQGQELLMKREENFELNREIDRLRGTLLSLQKEHNIVLNQTIQCSDSNESKDVLNELIERSEKQKEGLKKNIEESKKGFLQTHEECLENVRRFQREIEEIRARIEEVTREADEANKYNEGIKREISEIKIRLGNPQEGIETMLKGFDSLLNEFKQRKGGIDTIDMKVEGIKKNNLKVLEDFQTGLDKKKSKSLELVQADLGIENETHKVQETQKFGLEANLSKVSLEQVCCLRADLAQLSEDLTRMNQFYSQVRSDLISELDKGSSLLMAESEKVLVQTEKIDKIIDSIDKKEEELEGLKDVMGQAKKRTPPYVPVKDDLVDNMLGSYLNAKETPVPISFIRQDGGNYLFGTKKIYIKTENGKLLIKVGGGFTSIDEFLWIYTPVELEKADSSPRKGKA